MSGSSEHRADVSIMTLRGTASIDDLTRLGVTGIRTSHNDLLRDGAVDPEAIDAFREQWGPFVDAGFRLQVVSPFPSKLAGVDPAGPGWEPAWRRIGLELGRSLGDLVDAWQLGNELNLWHFLWPLQGAADAARFVFAVGEGLRQAPYAYQLGVNTFGVDETAAALCDAVFAGRPPIDLDFIGIDAYPGSWQSGGPEDWKATIDRAWELGRGRPIVVCELGFPSSGSVSDPGELAAFLATLGYRDIEAIRDDRARLIEVAPLLLQQVIADLPAEAWAGEFEDTACHLLKKWRHAWDDGPQTPAKQAAYFDASLSILLADPRVTEVVLFIWKGLETCWTCGMPDCPLETQWGLVDIAGRPKPAYQAVQRVIERYRTVPK